MKTEANNTQAVETAYKDKHGISKHNDTENVIWTLHLQWSQSFKSVGTQTFQ